jgi:hypothetical protein
VDPDLVAFGVHAPDKIGAGSSAGANHKEGGPYPPGTQNVEDVLGPFCRPVVEREHHVPVWNA